ncbi:MAG: hypothetical protein KBS41_04010 [Oscillospiraceae bacterium]|nr:hypothetical protein [Candidatus Equicaccousia limihippi]
MDKTKLFSILTFISFTVSSLSLLAASIYDIILQNSKTDIIETVLSIVFWGFLLIGFALVFVLRTITGGKILKFWQSTKPIDILILVFVCIYVLCDKVLGQKLPPILGEIIAAVSYAAFIYCFELHCILILKNNVVSNYEDDLRG